jgi:hypothetical protein
MIADGDPTLQQIKMLVSIDSVDAFQFGHGRSTPTWIAGRARSRLLGSRVFTTNINTNRQIT